MPAVHRSYEHRYEQRFWALFTIREQRLGGAPAESVFTSVNGEQRLKQAKTSSLDGKNFGLYRERVGLAAMITRDCKTKDIVQSQIQSIARGIYSMPPSYGGALVDIILNDQALNKEWVSEVDAMRTRMQDLRQLLVTKLAENGANRDFSFVTKQKGMFSFLCITPEQVQKVRSEHSVYFVDSSRVNIAGISLSNVDALAKALVSVL